MIPVTVDAELNAQTLLDPLRRDIERQLDNISSNFSMDPADHEIYLEGMRQSFVLYERRLAGMLQEIEDSPPVTITQTVCNMCKQRVTETTHMRQMRRLRDERHIQELMQAEDDMEAF